MKLGLLGTCLGYGRRPEGGRGTGDPSTALAVTFWWSLGTFSSCYGQCRSPALWSVPSPTECPQPHESPQYPSESKLHVQCPPEPLSHILATSPPCAWPA